MSWLDNLIGYISPERGYKREAWKQGLDELRSYDAGNYRNTNANWRVLNQSAEMTDRFSRDTIRARTRDLERNSDMFNSVTSAFKRNVVGAGYCLQSKTDNEEINRQLEKLWLKWCKKQNCDVTGTQSFNQIIRMVVNRKKVDGGIIILKRYTNQGFIPFQIQTIEVDELDNSCTKAKNPKNKVVGGIEFNEYNRPMGYYIRQYSLDGFLINEPVYIDAKDVIFYFTKKRPSQLREMSDLTPTVTRIRDTNEFMNAVSVKERIAACLAVFIKRVNPAGGAVGRQSDSRKDYATKNLTPGMIQMLNAGDEIDVVNPSGQASDATRFVQLHQRLIGAGQGISYEATSRDMSQSNYSSTRQGTIEDKLTYNEEIELLVEIMDEIYETFVISCVLAGKVNIKDFWDNKDTYLAHEWIHAPKPWIDPQKEANANRIALETGQKTFKQIAAENGKDWREQLDEMAEVFEYAEKKGIDLKGVIFNNAETAEDTRAFLGAEGKTE